MDAQPALDLGQILREALRLALSDLFPLLRAFWPLLLLLTVLYGSKFAFAVYRRRRLARAGLPEIDRMDGRVFEERLRLLFREFGYQVRLTPEQADYGADLILEKGGVRTAVQAKRHRSKVGVKAIQEVVAAKAAYGCADALVVTNSVFTEQARKLATINGVTLWDREALTRALLAVEEAEQKARRARRP